MLAQGSDAAGATHLAGREDSKDQLSTQQLMARGRKLNQETDERLNRAAVVRLMM